MLILMTYSSDLFYSQPVQWKHTYDPHIYVIPQCSLHDKEGTTNNNNTNIDT